VRLEDEAEFAGLVHRQWRFGYRVAWAVLRNTHDAEDAAQDAFLKILCAGAWRGLRDERAFVARAAWRAAVDRLRRSATQRRAAQDDLPLEELADALPGPEQTVMSASEEAAIHRLIDSLPEDLRQPLALSVEMNSREIAAAMGIAEGTVRTRLMRARQILREKIAATKERRYARQGTLAGCDG
jgi:RNA polymerase sigma-70 factor, ECF subfamily